MRKWMILILIFGYTGHSAALEGFQDVDIHGFISQGYLATTENNFFFSKTMDGTFQFNEMGLNFGTSPTDDLRLSIQFLAKDLGILGNDEVTIDYAMADYNYRDWLGLRVGKIKKAMGLYNQSRDVDAGRLSIFLPQSIYLEAYRDQSLAIKGASLYGRLFRQLDYQACYGVFDIPLDSGFSALMETFYQIQPLSYDAEPAAILSVLWNTPLEGLSLGSTFTTFEITANITDTVELTMKGNQPIVSLEFVYGNFMFSAEYEWHTAKTVITGSPIDVDTIKTDVEQYYAMMSYRFTPWLQIGGGHSMILTESHPSGLIPDEDLKDLFLSIKFDINDYWIFKLEGHGMHGVLFATDEDPDDLIDDRKENWQMYAVKLTYTF